MNPGLASLRRVSAISTMAVALVALTSACASSTSTDAPTPTFQVCATVQGLVISDSDKTGLLLKNNGGADTVEVTADGVACFDTKLPTGATYDVTAKAPAEPLQTCTVTDGSGTVGKADVTSIKVDCALDKFTVGGTAKVPVGTITLTNNGGDDLDVGPGAASFTFATSLLPGAAYDVQVKSAPEGMTCTVTGGSGVIATTSVTDVAVNCTKTLTFSFTGAAQEFVVPPGVTAVSIEAFGAQGGEGAVGGGGSLGGAGGKGGQANGTLIVKPGDVLTILVGGKGGKNVGGFNGGGEGLDDSGGGGGATDIRLNGMAASARVLVAGGGGGGGRAGCEKSVVLGGNGGNGGGGNGASGANAPTSGGNAGGGAGAVGSMGGAAGIGCNGFLGAPGANAVDSVGGKGGKGQTCCCFGAPSLPSGGGGGGGFVAGGGGGGGSAGTQGCSGNDKGGGGGGAGGTSFLDGVVDGVSVEGMREGDGAVTITLTLP